MSLVCSEYNTSEYNIDYRLNKNLETEKAKPGFANRNNTELLFGCNNRKVLIVDATTMDKSQDFLNMQKLINSMKDLVESWFGIFEVDYVQGYNFTRETIKDFTKYGYIFLLAHGTVADEQHWLVTGEPYTKQTSKLIENWNTILYQEFQPNQKKLVLMIII